MTTTLLRVTPTTAPHTGTPAPTMTVPTINFPELAHVGTLNPANKQDWSYEGAGLSVSTHPEEWEYIARLGGHPTWTLTTPTNTPFRMVDAHALTNTNRDVLVGWARTNGWVTDAALWAVPVFDEYTGDLSGRILFDTQEEAEYECGVLDDTERDGWPQRAHTVIATDTFPDPRVSREDPAPLVLALWAATQPDLDGVWWQDTYAPEQLSCPRGVLHTPCLATTTN